MKGLEALKDLKRKCLVLVEPYLSMKKTLAIKCLMNIIQSFDTIEKELKALDIIKNKNVFVWGFIHRQEEIDDFEPTYEYYKTHYGYFHSGYDCAKHLLTEKEYDLLKEVLL